jgi:hypothetical protein
MFFSTKNNYISQQAQVENNISIANVNHMSTPW